MSDKVRLHVKGLTYSERPTGAYALLLESEEDKRKLPIVIGAFEAQSIAIALDKMTRPPRPMTHDLFAAVMESHQIDLTEVVIRDLQDGVFYAILVFSKGGDVRVTDARPSDAIALALRSNCPIYAHRSVMDKASMAESEAKASAVKGEDAPVEEPGDSSETALETAETKRALGQASAETLDDLLNRALEHEDYELAARIRDELNKR
ncbi:MAG: bifunctional nuclease family protein [Schleiferiaceae bacterium]|nr:bifunctional nuclease family protein [Schleiferiaceae bacterium]